MKPSLNELGKLAKDKHIENKKYFDKLKKKAPKNLDYVMQELHNSEFKRLHLGSELSVHDIFGITVGINQGYPTAGLYADIYLVRLDADTYTEEVGERVGTRPDTRYFIRIMVGF